MSKKAVKEIVKEECKDKPFIEVSGTDAEIVAPKYHYANMIRELFKQDPEIKMEFDELECVIDMTVDNEIKALAIRRLLPEKKKMIDGTLTINVKLREDRFGGDKYLPETVYQAFKGNPIFDYQYWWEDPEHVNNPFCWVVMKPEVISYPESDLSHIYGSTVQLPAEIAKAIIPEITDNIFFCTDDNKHEMPDHSARKF